MDFVNFDKLIINYTLLVMKIRIFIFKSVMQKLKHNTELLHTISMK